MVRDYFDYSGYLVFTPTLIRSRDNGLDTKTFPDRVSEVLPSFESGTPKNPQSGFRQIDFHDYMLRSEHHGYVDEFRDLRAFEYLTENFSEKEAYTSEGERTEVYIRDEEFVDIFWFYPTITLFRGKKRIVDQAMSELQRIRKEDLLVETLTLSSDFLDLIYKNPEETLIDNEIGLETIQSAKFEGDGNISEVSVSTRVYGGDVRDDFAKGQDGAPRSISGVFNVAGTRLSAQISTERIHIRSSEEDMSDLLPIEQMAYSLYFTKRLVECALDHSKPLGDF